MRFPVAAKIAFVTAGAAHGTPGSPMPPDFSLFFTMCTSISGVFIDSQHRVVMKIALLNAALLEGELVVKSGSQAENHSALHLRFNYSWIHVSAAIHRTHYSMNPHLPVRIHRHLRNLRGVAFKRCMHGDAPRSPGRQRFSPSSFLGRQFE